jgi:hypothetical protein
MSIWTTSALVVYAEPLIVGRRVLVLAPVSGGAPALLLRLGARSVHVFEPTPSGEELGSRQVVVAPLPNGDFDVRDGAFDLAIVPDLDALTDAPMWLARLRRVLGPEGALLVATDRVEQDAYYRLYDAVALQFANVTMLAEVPFHGVAIVELGRTDDVDVSVDTQLMDAPHPPAGFVAMASQSPVHLQPYTIVESPHDEDSSSQAMTSEAPAALAESRLQVNLQATQLEEERTARQFLEHELHKLSEVLAAEKSARSTAERAAESAEDAIGLRERVTVLETSLQIAEESVELLSQKLVRAEESLQKKAEETLVLLAEIDAVRSAPPPSEPELEPDPRIDELLAELSHVQEVHAQEVHALEHQLRERASMVTNLTREARARERVAKELVSQLEEADTGLRDEPIVNAKLTAEVADLRKRLDATALDAARRESELEARAWRIGELETRLAQIPKSTQPSPASDHSALEEQIDALRQALTQEHVARVAAESGEALAAALREIERQSVLLHQLGVELEGRR